MDLKDIEQHWQRWAKEYHLDLRATTKTPTIKKLEINALHRAIRATHFADDSTIDILEVGCGNGYNCFGLADLLPNARLTGVDFIPDMVHNANTIRADSTEQERLSFFTGDILDLDACEPLKTDYDIVFTDRCIINLNTYELQHQAFSQLVSKTRPSGYVILIENVQQNYQHQNTLRNHLSLSTRIPDKFNLFLDEPSFLAHAQQSTTLIDTVDFASLHDLVLYVLIPSINNGVVDYEHPLVGAITNLLLENTAALSQANGPFGQNRLYVFQKNA